MSKLIEEDVAGRCTKVSEVVPEGIQPPEKTIYTYSLDEKEIAQRIWELNPPSPLSRAYKM
jgi:hypothetical protein